MRRSSACTLTLLGLFAAGIANAEDSKKVNDNNRKREKGMITRIDSKQSSVTVSIKGHDRNVTERTFPLASSAEYMDLDGKSAEPDAFQPGDHVRLTENDGKITEVKKCVDYSHAMIKRVDTENETITFIIKTHNDEESEERFEIRQDTRYLDQREKPAVLKSFYCCDYVRFTHKGGIIAELKKCEEQARATITKMDPDKGTVAVTMKDKNGEQINKGFTLTEESEYVDSTGQIAVVDVFQSGDEVLIIEADGKISELKKNSKPQKTLDETFPENGPARRLFEYVPSASGRE